MKIFGWIVATPFILLIIWGIGRLLFCSPDEGIRKVTDPLAKSIISHIEEFTKAQSLSLFKNLPYNIQECKTGEQIQEEMYTDVEREMCTFYHDNKKYYLDVKYSKRFSGKNLAVILEISNLKTNTNIIYIVSSRIDLFSSKGFIEESYTRSIKVPFLCKTGYLSIK